MTEAACGDRVALLRDVPTEDGDDVIFAGEMVWVIGHRGPDTLVASVSGPERQRFAIVVDGAYRGVAPQARRNAWPSRPSSGPPSRSSSSSWR
jgi:hypothetical protein